MLKKELSRLTKITGEIMNFSRTLETENIQIQKENIDIHTSIYGIYEEYMPRLQATNQYIKNISTAGTYISFDSDMWVQVVHNIVSNFIKYA
jgi:signal transduction histidine kinase